MNVQRGVDGKLRPFFAVVRLKRGGLRDRIFAAVRDQERERTRLMFEALFPPVDFHAQRMLMVR